MIKNAGHRAYKFIDKEYIAQGAMTQLFTIKQRAVLPTDINNKIATVSLTPVTSVGTAGQIMGRLEIMKPSTRFEGVNIKNEATHIGYTTWDRSTFKLDYSKLFIEVEYPYGNRLFKVLAIEDYSEMQKFIRYFLKETGYSSLEASNA